MGPFRDKRRRTAAINLTPLIDVLFLVVIFLVVTGRFVGEQALRLELPAAKYADLGTTADLSVSIDVDGSILLMGRPVSKAQLGPRLREFIRREGDKPLRLRADTAVDYGLIIEVLDIAKQNGVRRFAMSTALKTCSSNGRRDSMSTRYVSPSRRTCSAAP